MSAQVGLVVKKEDAMVDPKHTDGRTAETEAGLQAARKVWVTPRLETAFVADTQTGSGDSVDHSGGGAGTCIS